MHFLFGFLRLAKALHKPFVHAKLRQSRLEKRERAQFQHGDVEGEMADGVTVVASYRPW